VTRAGMKVRDCGLMISAALNSEVEVEDRFAVDHDELALVAISFSSPSIMAK
jgi:hypothetical protein